MILSTPASRYFQLRLCQYRFFDFHKANNTKTDVSNKRKLSVGTAADACASKRARLVGRCGYALEPSILDFSIGHTFDKGRYVKAIGDTSQE